MSRFRIITIEREYASGGREIGAKIASKLGIPCYGEEILEIAAKRYNTTAENLRSLEETATGSLLYSLYMMSHAITGAPTELSTADSLAIAEGEIIRDLASKERCVIIGRCGGCALRDRSDVLRVFIRSDMATRTARAIGTYGIAPEEAPAVLKKFDKRRAGYYNANSDLKWNDPAGYHMVLDSGTLGIDECVSLIRAAVVD